MRTSPNYPRPLKHRIAEAMTDTPVVLVTGPRQAGKTTLVRELASPQQKYITLDDELTLQAARHDPVGLIRGLDCAIIDEVQRAPELLLAIKKTVDEDRRPGRFLLTGSANLMLLPKVADSLAGRMETLTLLPLSQSEIQGGTANWLDCVFAAVLPEITVPLIGDALIDTVLRGGYPEAVSRITPRRRATWARQYVDALIQRDVSDIAEVGRLDQLPQFLAGLAQTAGQLCNYSQLGGQMGMDHKTAARYIGIFEQMFLLDRIAPWANNQLSRIVKTPKLQFIDSGLLAALLELNPTMIQQDRTGFGHLLESFVYGELRKHAATSDGRYRFSFYRDHDQLEVDLVLENAQRQVIGVEVKASATVRASDFRGLKHLASLSGSKFKMGVILYDGTQTLPFGDHLWIAPISTLWGKAPAKPSK
jgi:hypothetical protein